MAAAIILSTFISTGMILTVEALKVTFLAGSALYTYFSSRTGPVVQPNTQEWVDERGQPLDEIKDITEEGHF